MVFDATGQFVGHSMEQLAKKCRGPDNSEPPSGTTSPNLDDDDLMRMQRAAGGAMACAIFL
jgi:hypothetical protein